MNKTYIFGVIVLLILSSGCALTPSSKPGGLGSIKVFVSDEADIPIEGVTIRFSHGGQYVGIPVSTNIEGYAEFEPEDLEEIIALPQAPRGPDGFYIVKQGYLIREFSGWDIIKEIKNGSTRTIQTTLIRLRKVSELGLTAKEIEEFNEAKSEYLASGGHKFPFLDLIKKYDLEKAINICASELIVPQSYSSSYLCFSTLADMYPEESERICSYISSGVCSDLPRMIF